MRTMTRFGLQYKDIKVIHSKRAQQIAALFYYPYSTPHKTVFFIENIIIYTYMRIK